MRDSLGRWGPILVLIVVFLLIWLVNYRLGVGLMGDMANRDFMSLWVGGKAVTSGIDPYGPGVWRDLRVRYGSHWTRDPLCPFPLWTLVAVVPFSLLPLPAAAALLMTLSELGLILTVLLLLETTGRPRERSIIIPVLLGAMLSRPFLSALTSGQLTPLLTLFLAGGVILYARGQSLLAGVLFTLLLLKPNLPVLFLPAVGLLFLTRRDWRGLIGLGLGGAGLLLSSWLIQPGWPLGWLGVSEKTRVTFGMPTLWGLAFDLAPEQRLLVGTVATVVVSAATLLVVVRRHEDWQLGMGLAMCGSLLVTPYLWNYDQLLLLVPALIAFGRAGGRRWLRVMNWLLVIWVVPWGLFWVANRRGFDPLSVFVTFAIAGYLCASCWRSEGAG